MNSPHLTALGILLLGVLLNAGCEKNDGDYLVGTLERDRIVLPAELSEPVVETYAREGEKLKAGDHILQLDTTRAVIDRDQLIAKHEQASRRVDELVRGPRRESIREARARLAAVEAQLQNAATERQRIEQLASENLASASQRDAARAAHEEAVAEHDAARAALEMLLEGTTIEELDQARAQLAAATAAVHAQDALIERLTVKTPRTVRVEALPYETGSQPPRGANVAVLLADGPPHARVHVPVSLHAHYIEGTTVTVRVPGFGEFSGRVRWISADAAFTPYYALTQHDRDRLSHAAEIELRGDGVETLPTGVPVEVVAQ